jgi:hypothetical protein
MQVIEIAGWYQNLKLLNYFNHSIIASEFPSIDPVVLEK